MKLRFNGLATQFARRTAARTEPQATARASCQPPPSRAPTVSEEPQPAQVIPRPRKQFHWTIALVGVAVLLGGNLAAKRITFYRPAPVSSYNSRLAELDAKLSQALASQLHAAGFGFDAAIVSVEPPACERAFCLVKGLCREGPVTVKNRITARHAGNGKWSFAGMGELAGLNFDVDATAEMQRLAQSTPPEIPPVAQSALSLNQSGPHAASPFARELEVQLLAVTEGAQGQWLDFETARFLTEPDTDYFDGPGAYLEWCRTNSLDLSAVLYRDEGYWLFLSPAAITRVEAKLWEQATPEEIISHPGLRAIRQSHYSAISPAHDRSNTYLFRTQQGTFGILRLLEFDPVSRQVKIQYKLAQPRADADT